MYTTEMKLCFKLLDIKPRDVDYATGELYLSERLVPCVMVSYRVGENWVSKHFIYTKGKWVRRRGYD
jgi:hypothetical protein